MDIRFDELSLNILDICQNSIDANAKNVLIDICVENDTMTIKIIDDGDGMDEDTLRECTNPFVTSKSSNNAGIGLTLLKESCESAGGSLSIQSTKGGGTIVKATFEVDNIHRAPLGDMGKTMIALLDDKIHYTLKVSVDGNQFWFDTNDLYDRLDGVSVMNAEIRSFVKDLINENLIHIGGAKL